MGLTHPHLFTSKGKGEIFAVGWVDYDSKYNFDVQKELEANRDNFVKDVQGTLGSTTKINLKDQSGD